MRAYAALLLAQVGKDTSSTRLDQLRSLAERANSYLARLFKIEHYFNRMRDMEVTISRLSAVMQSMADPVICTDDQHRVVIQNRAAERFFRVPEGIGDGGRRAVELNNLLFSAALSSRMVSGKDTSRDLTLVDVMEGEEVLFEGYEGDHFRPRMFGIEDAEGSQRDNGVGVKWNEYRYGLNDWRWEREHPGLRKVNFRRTVEKQM